MTDSTELSTAFINECNPFIVSSTEDIQAANQSIVFPNPTRSAVFFETDLAAFSPRDEVVLYSSVGRRLFTTMVTNPQTRIDLSTYPKGVYFLVATINGVSKTFPVLRE